MVTSRQFARGMVRTMRAIDREAKRAQRQRIAYEKAAQKQAIFEASAAAAAEYDRMVEAIVGSHRIPLQRRDWLKIATAPEQSEPQYLDRHERKARRQLDDYVPGWFARTFGLEARKREELERAVKEARHADEREFEQRRPDVERENARIQYAQRVVALDHAAVVEVLDEYTQLGNLPFAVEGVDVLFTDDNRIIAMVDGLDLDDMPDQSVTLLQSGKASIKALTKSRVLELHRINICSSALRVALEFLNALPLDAVEVVMQSDILDRATGHIEAKPVLYVRVTAQALGAVNLHRADADALVDRLGGHYEFDKRDAFRPLNLATFNVPSERTVED